MNSTSNIKALYKKEILDILRDKKTIIMMVVVPILLYPLIMIAGILLVSKVSESQMSEEYRITFDHIANIDEIESTMADSIGNDTYSYLMIQTADPQRA